MKKTLLATLTLAVIGAAMPAVQAETYTLGEVVVTATRSEKQDIDVPMSTTVISGEKLQKMGANNLQTALSTALGVAFKQFGPSGSHMGTMNTEVAIRGIKTGTLVMINGTPINARGKYFMDAIPTERIERVEIIKGGGSVLYGSEAMAGVINIITKKEGATRISVGLGNYGQQKTDLEFGNQYFTVTGHREAWGRVGGVSIMSDGYRYMDSPSTRKYGLSAEIRPTDELRFTISQNKSASGLNQYFSAIPSVLDGKANIGDLVQDRIYTAKHRLIQGEYKTDDFALTAYMNRTDILGDGSYKFYARKGKWKVYNKPYHRHEATRTTGVDIQKTWDISENTNLITGFSFMHENFNKTVGETDPAKAAKNLYSRHHYGAYAQLEQTIGAKDTAIIAGRQTWTTAADGDKDYKKFSGSIQWLHQLNDDENLYMNISESFVMPTFAQMYGASDRAIPNPGLKPQSGTSYEIGYKKLHGNHSYKVAVFHAKIKDNIKVNLNKQTGANGTTTLESYSYGNSDFKNTGIEAEMAYQGDGPWSYNIGILYHDPQYKDYGDGAKKPYWDRSYGRWQLSGGLTYTSGKWTSTITASYLGDRVGSPSSSHSFSIKPYLLTTWNTTYQMNDNESISLRLDNVLDREDNMSNSGSYYRSTPFNYLVSYNYQF